MLDRDLARAALAPLVIALVLVQSPQPAAGMRQEPGLGQFSRPTGSGSDLADAGPDSAADVPLVGLAHVDLMDLHVERRPDGTFADRELLPAADLADRYRTASSMGAGWNRWSMYWDMIERDEPGVFDWRAADGIVRRDVAAGIGSLVILQGTPSRYATGGSLDASPPPVGGWFGRHYVPISPAESLQGLSVARVVVSTASAPPSSMDVPAFVKVGGGLTDDPAQAETVNPGNPWARFVGAAAARYRPGGQLASALGWPEGSGVSAWEIGNEPNLAHFWSGTPEQFARYLEVAYLVIRWTDPGATIMHGGIADAAGADDWFDSLLAVLKAKSVASPLPRTYGYYFDKTAWHWYVYPNLLHTGPDSVRSLLRARGIPEKPVWVTEMGVPIWSEYPGPCWDPSSPWRATTAEAAGYVWQAASEGVASAVETLFLFQSYDDCGNGPQSYDAFGLVRNHGSNQCWVPPGHVCWSPDESLFGVPRPAYEAAAWAALELADAELLWRPPQAEPRWQRLLLYRPPAERVTVAWNWYRADQPVELTATGREGVLLSLGPDGRPSRASVVPVSGRYGVVLPGSTNRNNPGNGAPVMAGHPVMLVETDVYAPFRGFVEPLPPESNATVELVISAADGGTGVASVQLFVAEAEPGAGGVWRAATDELAWTELHRGGRMRVLFHGATGTTYWFAAVARDRAGNGTALPDAAQAWTHVVGPGGSPTATAPVPGTDTPAPPQSPTVTREPSPSITPAGPPWASNLLLPVAFAWPPM